MQLRRKKYTPYRVVARQAHRVSDAAATAKRRAQAKRTRAALAAENATHAELIATRLRAKADQLAAALPTRKKVL